MYFEDEAVCFFYGKGFSDGRFYDIIEYVQKRKQE